jgi:hypothetical protein
MVTRFYGIKTGVRKVSVPNIIGINKTQARINLSNISLTYLEQTTPGTVLSDNDIVSAQGTASGSVIPRGSVVQYTYKVFTFTPPYFPPFFPPFFPPHFPPFFPPFFPPHFPPFFPPFFPPHFPPFFPPFFPPHFPPFFPPYFPAANTCNTPGCSQYSGSSAGCANCSNCVNNFGGYWTGSACLT